MYLILREDFLSSCAQIFEAYAVRTVIKFGCDWRKIGRKGKCMKDSESTYYTKGGFDMNQFLIEKRNPILFPESVADFPNS